MIIGKKEDKRFKIIMATKELTYNEYLYLLNRIAYWLQKNNKKVTTKNEYKIGNDSKSLKVIINTIKKHGTNYNSNEFIGRYVEYIIISKKDDDDLPSYVSSKDGKRQYSKASYKDMVTRVVKFRKDKGRNPKAVKGTYNPVNTTTVKTTTSTTPKVNTTKKTSNVKKKSNCTNPYKSTPHYTATGCNKLGQCTSYYCAPHCIHQALRKFGITSISEKTLASWAGTTSSGTDHDGINTAVAKASKKTGVKLKVEWKYFSDFGKNNSERFLNVGKVACQSNKAVFEHIGYQCSGSCKTGTVFGHYEMFDTVDTKKKQVRALNSLGDKCNSPAYCGHIQWRSYDLEAHYINNKTGVKSICIITKL